MVSNNPHVYTKSVSSWERTLRPSLAKVRGERREPFAAYLVAAQHDAEAAQGLALAYTELPDEARREIVDAVADDSAAEGLDAAPLLASLLSVETDLELARHIAALISMCGGAGLAVQSACRALFSGDESDGTVVLARPLHADFVELLQLSWTQVAGLSKVHTEPLIRSAAVAAHCASLSMLRFEQIPVAFAIDLIAPVLWHHHRAHGELPAELSRFAQLFDVDLGLTRSVG